MNHFNQLTPAEAERLSLLLEEMGEAIQIIGKIQRHGYASTDPTSQAVYPPTNRELLERELGDVYTAIRMMGNAKDINEGTLNGRMDLKLKTVKRYLHHQPTDNRKE